jgi:hypothetical protein
MSEVSLLLFACRSLHRVLEKTDCVYVLLPTLLRVHRSLLLGLFDPWVGTPPHLYPTDCVTTLSSFWTIPTHPPTHPPTQMAAHLFAPAFIVSVAVCVCSASSTILVMCFFVSQCLCRGACWFRYGGVVQLGATAVEMFRDARGRDAALDPNDDGSQPPSRARISRPPASSTLSHPAFRCVHVCVCVRVCVSLCAPDVCCTLVAPHTCRVEPGVLRWFACHRLKCLTSSSLCVLLATYPVFVL